MKFTHIWSTHSLGSMIRLWWPWCSDLNCCLASILRPIFISDEAWLISILELYLFPVPKYMCIYQGLQLTGSISPLIDLPWWFFNSSLARLSRSGHIASFCFSIYLLLALICGLWASNTTLSGWLVLWCRRRHWLEARPFIKSIIIIIKIWNPVHSNRLL